MNKSFKNHLQTKINQILRNKKDTEAISDVIESFKVSKKGLKWKRKKDTLKILFHFQRAIESRSQIIQYLLGLEVVFIDLLKSRDMTITIVPLKTLGKNFCI